MREKDVYCSDKSYFILQMPLFDSLSTDVILEV